MTFFLAKRFFRFDGGAEVATRQYMEALPRIFKDCRLLTEADLVDVGPFSVNLIRAPGLTRDGRLARFGRRALMAASGHTLQAHEWIPGAHVMRLGGGLHSIWAERVLSLKNRLPRFHRHMIQLEQATLLHPNLKLVIANSELVAREVKRTYPKLRAEVAVIRNSIQSVFNTAPLETDYNPGRLLFVGSGWERKGLKFVIGALANLPSSFSLEVVGQDKNAARYMKLAHDLGVSERVRFSGAKPMTPLEYSRSQCLIIPSLYDPFPNVALEALSQGVPVITSEFTGASDFGRDLGVSVSALDAIQLAEVIQSTSDFDAASRRVFAEYFRQLDTAYLVKSLSAAYQSAGILGTNT